MSSLALYHNGLSTCSQKVRLVLAEKGLDFESHVVDGPAAVGLEEAVAAVVPGDPHPRAGEGRQIEAGGHASARISDVRADTRKRRAEERGGGYRPRIAAHRRQIGEVGPVVGADAYPAAVPVLTGAFEVVVVREGKGDRAGVARQDDAATGRRIAPTSSTRS